MPALSELLHRNLTEQTVRNRKEGTRQASIDRRLAPKNTTAT